jgi:outer membrane autotransporter protein
VLQKSWYSGDGEAVTGTRSDISGGGFLASIEIGYGFKLSQSWMLEPQFQIIGQRDHIDTIYIPTARIRFDDNSSLTTRLGLRLVGGQDGEAALKPYLRANLWHSQAFGVQGIYFDGPAASTFIDTKADWTSGELGGGFTWKLMERLNLYSEVDHMFDIDNKARQSRRGTAGSFGVRWEW